MTRAILLICLILIAGCSGGTKNGQVSERELYHEKRIKCDRTKTTDETANITQCADIRPDTKK